MHRSLNVRRVYPPAPYIPPWGTTTASGDDTHIAGIVGAKNSGQPGDVVGVAPGTVIYSLNIFKGLGTTDAFVAAVNWLAANAAQQVPPIKVVTLPMVEPEDDPNTKYACGNARSAEQAAIWCVRAAGAARRSLLAWVCGVCVGVG